MTIWKPWRCNLGIGIVIVIVIVIETDTIKAIISTLIRPMDPKLTRVVT